MYVKIENGVVRSYPYSTFDLRRDNPNTSFPADPIPDDALAGFGVFPVGASGSPAYNRQTQRVEQGTPINQNGQWVQNWVVVDLSQAEIEANQASLAQQVRAERNEKLADTDWRFRSDMTPSQEWIDYCQALRDITAQEGFPWDIQWPEQPK